MSATAAGSNQQKAVVNWLSNNSVSIVQVDAIPTEARQEHAITQVQWGSSKPVARIVKISRSESDLERAATALCEDIEAMEKGAVIVKHKRPPKPNKKFLSGATDDEVARKLNSKSRKKLPPAVAKQKKELSKEQKEIMAIQSQFKKKKEEELLMRSNADVSSSKRVESTERSSVTSHSKVEDQSVNKGLQPSTPASVSKKLFQPTLKSLDASNGNPPSASSKKLFQPTLKPLDASNGNPPSASSTSQGASCLDGTDDSEDEVEVEDETALKQSAVFKFIKDCSSPSNVKFLRKLANLMDDLLERPKQISYIPLKQLEAGQAVEYIGVEPNQVPITKKSKLSVEFAAASYVAKLDCLRKSNKKQKINILAPTKAATRKLLTELFTLEDLKNVTVKGTGKSRKAIPENVLMAMYQYIDEITPENRKISMSEFSKVILKKGSQVGETHLKSAGLSKSPDSSDEDDEDQIEDSHEINKNHESDVEHSDGGEAEYEFPDPDVQLKRKSVEEHDQDSPSKKLASASNTGATPQKPLATPVFSPLKKNTWIIDTVTGEESTASALPSTPSSEEVVTSTPDAPVPPSVARPTTAALGVQAVHPAGSTTETPGTSSNSVPVPLKTAALGAPPVHPGSATDTPGTSSNSVPPVHVPNSYWVHPAPAEWYGHQQYNQQHTAWHYQQQPGPPPSGWQAPQQQQQPGSAWQHHLQPPAPSSTAWPQQQQSGSQPTAGWNQWQQAGPPPSQWGPAPAWQPPASHAAVNLPADAAQGQPEQC